MKLLRRWLLLGVLIAGSGLAAGADEPNAAPLPDGLGERFVVLPAGWLERTPPVKQVNVPPILDAVHPGQTVQLALLAAGPERDALLAGLTGRATFRVADADGGGAEIAFGAGTIKHLKAVGADMVLTVLKAAGVAASEEAKMREMTALQALAVLAPTWTVPADATDGEIVIDVAVSGSDLTRAFAPQRLAIQAGSMPVPVSMQDAGEQMTRYRPGLAPAQVVAWLRAFAGSPAMGSGSVYSYFVHSWREFPAMRAAAIAAYPDCDDDQQRALLATFKLAGLDLAECFPAVPAEFRAQFETVPVMPDPRRLRPFVDPVAANVVRNLGNTMDQCWSGWTVTGDASYLRTLVDLLVGAADYPVLQEWIATKGGAEGLNARVANGLAYQIAGWSIRSFQRTDPLVADWLAYWREDPGVPEVIRAELAGLATNPIFRRDQAK